MRTLWLRFCRWIGICTDKILRRPPPPCTEEEAARHFTELLQKAKKQPDHPVFRKYAGHHEMGVVIPRDHRHAS